MKFPYHALALGALLAAAPLAFLSAPSPVMAAESGGGAGLDCDGSQSYADLVAKYEGGGKGASATNPDSTASGSYQFTFGTLKELGFIKSGSTPGFGEDSWSGVEWTGKGGVYSRDDFFKSNAAQDLALSELTEKNLKAVEGLWEGKTVNGVPLTAGGVAFATHQLGAGGFQAWAASGFTSAGLNPTHAKGHHKGLSEAEALEAYQNHFVNRLAKGGCMDPGIISSGESDIGPMAEVGLMPWDEHKMAVRPIFPGQLQSLGQQGRR